MFVVALAMSVGERGLRVSTLGCLRCVLKDGNGVCLVAVSLSCVVSSEVVCGMCFGACLRDVLARGLMCEDVAGRVCFEGLSWENCV